MILHYSFIHTLGGTGWSPSRGSPDVEPPQPVVMGGLTCMGVGQTHTQACITYLPLTRHIVTIVNFGSSGKEDNKCFVAFRLCFNFFQIEKAKRKIKHNLVSVVGYTL